MTGLKTAVRRYDRHVHVVDWNDMEVAVSVGVASTRYHSERFVIRPLGFAVTNARLGVPHGVLTLVGRDSTGTRAEQSLRQADDGRWVIGNVERYHQWVEAQVDQEQEPEFVPDAEDMDAIEMLG